MPAAPPGVQSAHMCMYILTRTHTHAGTVSALQTHVHSLFLGYIVTATKLMRSQLSLSVFTFVFLCFLPKTIAQKAVMGKMHITSVLPPPLWNSRVPTWQPRTKTLSSPGKEAWDSRDMAEPGSQTPPGWVLIGHSCCCRDGRPIVKSRRNKTVKELSL